MKLTVAIPCYNEVENVVRIPSELLPEVRKLGVDFEILVVDDGSRDGTAEAAEGLKIAELRVVRHPGNRGLGAGIETMFREARGELLVTMDADLTFEPKDIAKLLERYEVGDVDFVIGSHGLAGYAPDVPRYRVLVSRLANWIYSILSGREVKGISSIFRLYRTEIVRNLPVTTSGYETPAETFFRLVRSGYRFAEVPTPLGKRRFGTSKLNYRREIPRQLRLVLDIVLGRISGTPRAPRVRRWLPAIVLMIAVAVLYSIPNIVLPMAFRAAGGAPGDYHPMSLGAPVLDEVMSYGSRIREVIDGHLSDGDAYAAEYKSRPTMWGNTFMAAAVGLPARFLGIRNPTGIFVWGDAVFPAVVALIAFGLLHSLFRDRWVAAAAAFILVAFPNLSSIRFGVAGFSTLGIFDTLARLFDPWFSRIPVPSPGIAIFFGFLWVLLSSLKKAVRPGSSLLTGLLLGLSLHTYIFYGAFAWTVVGLLLIGFVVSRNWDHLRRMLVTIGVGALVSIPYGLKLLALRTVPYADELRLRVGLEFGRDPRLSAISITAVIVMIAVLILVGRKVQKTFEAAVLSVFLLATVIVLNFQLILGFSIQPDHWGSRVNVYIYVLGLMAALVWAWEVVRHSSKTLRWVAVLTMVFMFGIGVTQQVRSALINPLDYTIQSEVQDALRWVDQNVPRDEVVVSPSSITSAYVPFFTAANVYFLPACYTLASNEEIRARWLELASVFGVPEKTFFDALLGNADWTRNPIRGRELDPSYMLFCDTYTRYQKNAYVGGDSRRPVPPDVAEALLADYRAALARTVPKRLRFANRADYVFFGPSEKLISSVQPERYENLDLVYENQSVKIYKIGN